MVAEFLLIVIAVAAGLGVDRWVQGIDDSKAEEEYLALVLRDAEANAGIFEGMVLDWEAARDATADLIEAVENPTERPTHAGLLIAVARAGTVNTVPARDASFRDMESTGNVRLISDRQLRAQIVDYFTQDIRFGRPMIEDRLDLRFRTFAREFLPPDLWGHRTLCASASPAFDCRFEDPPSSDRLWAALTGNASMTELLNSRYADAISGSGVARGWAARTDELLVQLRRALGQ